jgi:hypothetical protein
LITSSYSLRLIRSLRRPCEEQWRDGNAERLGGLEVHDKLKGAGLHHRQVGLATAKESPSIPLTPGISLFNRKYPPNRQQFSVCRHPLRNPFSARKKSWDTSLVFSIAAFG